MIDKFRGNYYFLSNFYPCKVQYRGITYPTSEAAYQAQKTLDENERLRISRLEDPHDAKKEGQKLDLRKDWNDVKVIEMYLIVENKFAQNPDLKKLLLQTGDEILVEGNDWDDTFWGVCGEVGENKLGKILMMVRNSMRTMNYR